MADRVVARAIVLTALAAACGIGAVAAEAQERPGRFEDVDLFLERNATDGDAAFVLTVGGEPWRELELRDPRGRTVLDVTADGRMRVQGVADLVVETESTAFDELPLRRFLRRFPTGRYRLTGTTVEGRRLVGSDRLTHAMPAAPNVLAPMNDATVDRAAGLVVRWEPVSRPSGIAIDGYVVAVTEADSDRELTLELPRTATSATVPPEFLRPETRYTIDVIARERSGNQTTTEVGFTTGA
jgi:hypothetical protein